MNSQIAHLLNNNSEDNISLNKNSIKVFGLTNTIYCSELIEIFLKAERKKKLYGINNDFFKVDREYIKEQTSLTVEEQLECDEVLSKSELIIKDNIDTDLISFNFDFYASVVTSDDKKLTDIIKKVTARDVKKLKAEKKETKKQAILNSLKNSIKCSNEELLQALKDWVDSCYGKYGYLSTKIITTFQTDLNNYTKGDLDLALDILKIATINSWKDCAWAISSYEKTRRSGNQKVRVTQQKVSNGKLSEEIF